MREDPLAAVSRELGRILEPQPLGFEQQAGEIERNEAHESTRLPEGLDYAEVRGLSFEARQKLSQIRPETIGQASRISGITPAAISLLMVHLKRGLGRRATKSAEPGADTAPVTQ